MPCYSLLFVEPERVFALFTRAVHWNVSEAEGWYNPFPESVFLTSLLMLSPHLHARLPSGSSLQICASPYIFCHDLSQSSFSVWCFITFGVERRCLNNPLHFREIIVSWVDAIAKSVTGNRRTERNFLQQHVLFLLLLVEATLSKGSAACNYFGLSFTRTNFNSHQQGHTSVSNYMKCVRRE